jgi:hypothetical protein
MNRRVIFKTLWLVSERERKAAKQSFSQSKTLLLGENGTGKSRIIKNLLWVFGCMPEKRNIGGWDPDTVAALDFSYDGNDYLALRQGKRLGLFSSDNEVLFAADNMSAWESFIAPFFGYRLQLQRPNSTRFSQAGLEYLTLPFYLDQDGSWGTSWDTYTTLSQFKNWKPLAFEAFIGLRPNAYFAAKQLKDKIHGQLVEKQKELEAQRIAFHRVREVLPRNVPSLNTATFRAELSELGRKVLKVQQQQVALRGKLIATVNLRQKVESELQLAVSAHRELVEDLVYLSDVPSTVLECPTCGTIHENSFHARLQLSQDSDSIAALVAELNNKLTEVRENEARIRGELRSMGKALDDIDSLMHEKKARLRLDDILAAHSKKTLSTAFQRVTADLGAVVRKLEDQEELYKSKLKQFEDRSRLKEVRKYYADQVISLSQLLNVPTSEQVTKPRPGARAQAGGSSQPRSILATHLALLRTNVQYGDSPFFPFVVDTPQQSGQDDKNLGSMINLLGRSAGEHHQVILAVEKLPEGIDTSEFEVFVFDMPQGVLRSTAFAAAVDRLQAPLRDLKAAVESALAKDRLLSESNLQP